MRNHPLFDLPYEIPNIPASGCHVAPILRILAHHFKYGRKPLWSVAHYTQMRKPTLKLSIADDENPVICHCIEKI